MTGLDDLQDPPNGSDYIFTKQFPFIWKASSREPYYPYPGSFGFSEEHAVARLMKKLERMERRRKKKKWERYE